MTAALQLPTGPLTLDDVTAIAEADDRHRFELVEGNLVVMSPPTWRHQQISLDLGAWLIAGGYRTRVAVAPCVRTDQESLNGRLPDVVVAKHSVPPDTVWMAPEAVLLAIEIVSKGSERTDRWFKPLEFAEAGIPHFWRVEPDETVVRFRLVDGAYATVGRQALDGMLGGAVPPLD